MRKILHNIRYSLLISTLRLCFRIYFVLLLFLCLIEFCFMGNLDKFTLSYIFINLFYYSVLFFFLYLLGKLYNIFYPILFKLQGKGIFYIQPDLNNIDYNPLVEFIDSLPIELKEKIKRNNLKIYIKKKKKIILNPKVQKAVAYYHPLTNSIKIFIEEEQTDFTNWGFKVFLHEFAHYLDYSFGNVSSDLNFRRILFNCRKAEYSFYKQFGTLDSPLLKVNSLKDRAYRVLFYITKLNVFDVVPYGLQNRFELFADIFTEIILLNKVSNNLYIPYNYYFKVFTNYYLYIEVEKLDIYFYELLHGRVNKFPILKSLPSSSNYLWCDRINTFKSFVLVSIRHKVEKSE